MSTTRSKLAVLGVTAAAGAAMLGLAGTAVAQSNNGPNPPANTPAAGTSTAADQNEAPETGNEAAETGNEAAETGNEGADGANETDAPDPALAAKAKITEAEATATAVKAQPDGKVVHAEVQDEDGTIVWGVELATPNGEHDVKIDASTGALVKNEADGAEENGATETGDTTETADTAGSSTATG